MELYEYQIKNYLEDNDIRVPQRFSVTSENSVRQIIGELSGIVLLKPQISPSTVATAVDLSYQDLADITQQILDNPRFLTTRSILVETQVPIVRFVQVEFRTDRAIGKIKLTVNIYHNRQQMSAGEQINVFIGLRAYQTRNLANEIDLPEHHWSEFTHMLQALFKFYVQNDAERLTINQLGFTENNTLIVLDANMRVDDNALHRQKKYMMLQLLENQSGPVAIARKSNITLIKLSGSICCIANGSGLSVALLDEIQSHGLTTAMILDIGSIADESRLIKAINLAQSSSQTLVISVFGHLMTCDEIIDISRKTRAKNTKIYLHLSGIGDREAVEKLNQHPHDGIFASDSLKTLVGMANTHLQGE